MNRALLASCFVLAVLFAHGQDYAEIGTGIHRQKITWLRWTDPSLANGIHNGDSESFTLPTGEIINVTFSNVVFTPSIPGSGNYLPADIQPPWATGANSRAFHPNYNFISTSDNGMLYSGAAGSNQNGQNISFDINFSATRNGVAYVPDLVFVDPESTNPAFLERITAVTNGANWSNIENLQGTNYTVTGFGSSTIDITDTESPQHAPLLLTKRSTRLSVAIRFPNGDGHAGVTFGVLAPYDLSDAPASYGDAAHFQNYNASAGPGMTNNSTVYMGAVVPDVEIVGSSANALGDDGNGIDDDDAVTFPLLARGASGLIDVNVNGAGGYLQAWIDYNANGTFNAADRIATNVQDGGAGDNDGLVNGNIQLLITVPVTASTGTTYARFRWSTTSGLNATTTASNGEVEDYAVSITTCSFSTDTDGDGISDVCDLDDDNDGIPDVEEGGPTADTDMDGIPNTLDLDSDNDGIFDCVESGVNAAHTNGVLNGAVNAYGIPVAADTNGDGTIDYAIADSDLDSNYDFIELDSDGDLCTDVLEAGYTDANNDGELGDIPLTVDGDGIVTSGGP